MSYEVIHNETDCGRSTAEMNFVTMLKFPSKLAERLDQWTDNWNPVLVRELRRSVRKGYFQIIAALYLLVVPAIPIFFFFEPPLPHDIPKEIPSEAFVGCVVVWVTFYFLAAMSLIPSIDLVQTRFRDEILSLTGMTPKEVFWGYFQLGTYLSGSVCCCTLAILILCRCLGGSILLPLLLLLLAFTGSLVINLFLLSFCAKIRTMTHLVIAGLSLYFLQVPCIVVGVIVITVADFTQYKLKLVTFSAPPLGVILFLAATGIVLLGITAYRLALYHFEHPRERFFAAMVRNFLYYNGVGIFMIVFSFLLIFAYAR